MHEGRGGLPRIELVVRFGSTVAGRARRDSDVDVAVLGERALTLEERGSVLADLAGRCAARASAT
jgi:predicted nucleotidyltransferase